MSAPTAQVHGYVAGNWTIDAAHSEITYSVKHLGIAKSRGNFPNVSGRVVTGDNIMDSQVTAEIDMNSVDSGQDGRDEHLKGEEFFDVANHPTMTFRSTGIRAAGDDYIIDGELNWRGVNQPVELKAEFNGVGTNPANNDATTLGVSAEATVNRRHFGIGPEGNSFLSEQVKITLEIEAYLDN